MIVGSRGAGVLQDPRALVEGVAVDPRDAVTAAAVAKADGAGMQPPTLPIRDHQGATAVALAGIPTSARHSGREVGV